MDAGIEIARLRRAPLNRVHVFQTEIVEELAIDVETSDLPERLVTGAVTRLRVAGFAATTARRCREARGRPTRGTGAGRNEGGGGFAGRTFCAALSPLCVRCARVVPCCAVFRFVSG
jgi:hypothetical protein